MVLRLSRKWLAGRASCAGLAEGFVSCTILMKDRQPDIWRPWCQKRDGNEVFGLMVTDSQVQIDPMISGHHRVVTASPTGRPHVYHVLLTVRLEWRSNFSRVVSVNKSHFV
jgi:hypothetical protein